MIRTAKLGEVADVVAGVGFPKEMQGHEEGEIPVFKVGDISTAWLAGERVLRTSRNYLTGDHARRLGKPVPAGSTVFAKIGEALRLNRRAILGQPSLVDNNVMGVVPRTDALAPLYLFFFMQTVDLGKLARATAVPSVRKSDVVDIGIPLPSLAAQEHVVAEIEKQFSRLDEAVANLKRVKANLKRYRAAVLKAAVEGRLVATEAELTLRSGSFYEPASVLLSHTASPPRPNRYASRSGDVIAGHAALSVGHTGGALPEGWAWAALVDIARMESGHTPSRNHPEWWAGDVPWIGIVDAREHHGGVINDTSQHTNAAGLENSAARLLPAGTVCISRTASVGYVVVMGRPMATSQDFVNWIPTDAVTSDWLRIVFLADREALLRFGKGSVHKTIYFPEWLAVHIAVPPLAEQQRIAKEVDRQLSIASAAEAAADQQLVRAARLREAVLARAFGRATDTNIDRREAAVGAEAMTRARLPVLPPDRGTEADDSRLDLVEVLAGHPEGMEPEALFRAAGYKGDQIDDFYRDLDAIRDQVAVATTEAEPREWPARTVVRVALRKR